MKRVNALLSVFVAGLAVALCSCGGSSSVKTSPPPTFTSTAPAAAHEGVAYTYSVSATDPGGGTVTLALSSGPDGAALTGSTLTWTPTHAQSRTDNAFVITATTSEGTSAKQSFKINPNGTINGTLITHIVTGAGVQNYPVDLSTVPVEALLPGSGGSYTAVSGTGDANGNFTVQDVPGGSFWMHLARQRSGQPNDLFFWTSASDLDLGGLGSVRPDAVRTQIGVDIYPNVNLSVAPLPNDYIQWTGLDGYSSVQITPPITTPFTEEFQQYGYLMDASKNDRAFLVHYTVNSAGVSTAAESIAYNNITEIDGGSVNIAGSMASGNGWTCDPVIAVTQFDSVLAGAHNDLEINRTFTMMDVAYDGTEGYTYGGVPLISADLSSASGNTDLGSLSYGMVTSVGVPFVDFVEYRWRKFDLGNGWVAFGQPAEILTNVIPTASAPIAPAIGLPVSLTINGHDFGSDQAITSLTPTLSWAAPTVGTAAEYYVQIFPILGNAVGFWTFVGNSTSFVVPPGVLQAGNTYVFYVEAISDASLKASAAPFRYGAVRGLAGVMSGAITTPASGPALRRHLLPASPSHIRIKMGRNGDPGVQK